MTKVPIFGLLQKSEPQNKNFVINLDLAGVLSKRISLNQAGWSCSDSRWGTLAEFWGPHEENSQESLIILSLLMVLQRVRQVSLRSSIYRHCHHKQKLLNYHSFIAK